MTKKEFYALPEGTLLTYINEEGKEEKCYKKGTAICFDSEKVKPKYLVGGISAVEIRDKKNKN